MPPPDVPSSGLVPPGLVGRHVQTAAPLPTSDDLTKLPRIVYAKPPRKAPKKAPPPRVTIPAVVTATQEEPWRHRDPALRHARGRRREDAVTKVLRVGF